MRRHGRRVKRMGVASCRAALALGALACSGEAVDTRPLPGPLLGLTVREAVQGATNEDALVTGQDCSGLLTAVQAELLDQLARTVHGLRLSRGLTSPEPAPEVAPSEVAVARLALEVSVPAPGPAAPGIEGGSAGFSVPTLVPGVDEGDSVKAEGDRIYRVDWRSSRLDVLAGWPATALELLTSVPIEGAAAELLVDHGVVSVFSRISGGLDRLAFESYPSYEPVFTKITVVDTTVTPAAIRRESYVEGDYVRSRRIGSVVYAVAQQSPKVVLDWPEIVDRDIFGRSLTAAQVEEEIESWARLTAETIEASTLEDYLPGWFEYEDGFPVSRGACQDDFVSPGAGLGATSVLSVDLATPDATVSDVRVHGSPATVTFDAESFVVQNYLRRDRFGDVRSMRTQLHLFGLEGAKARYLASGSTRGFAENVSRRGDVLRATTVEELYDEGGYLGNETRAVALARDETGLTELPHPLQLGFTDSVATARFDGDRGYVVGASATRSEGIGHYELVVVDFSDPSSPRLDGRVPVVGNISALLPAADGRLAGVAEGYPQGVALQLFDVSDPAAPAVVAEYDYPDAAYTSAVGDPRAISFLPERNLLAFPVTDQTYSSSLELFELSAGSLTRLGSVAPVVPPPALVDCLALFGYPTDPDSVAIIEADPMQLATLRAQCDPIFTRSEVVRGWFRGDAVFAAGTTRIAAFGLDALTGPPQSQVDLP
jgi:hypothetical protein